MQKSAEEFEISSVLPAEYLREVNSRGLDLVTDLEYDKWLQCMRSLVRTCRRYSNNSETFTAWIADALLHKQGLRYGEISEWAHAAGLSAQTLRTAKLTCQRIELFRRRNNLSWTHHTEIASRFKEAVEIESWLERASNNRWSIRELRTAIQAAKLVAPNSAQSSFEPPYIFEILRQLRATDRALRSNPPVVKSWSFTQCREFLANTQTLAKLMTEIRSRIEENAV